MEFDLFEEWLLRKFLGSPGVAVATSGANTLTTVKAPCLDIDKLSTPDCAS